MSDLVTCICVLTPARDGVTGFLYVECSPDFRLRMLPVRRKGIVRTQTPEWEYEEKDGRLHITPSLLCVDTKFHTAYNWDCAFQRCPEGESAYNKFYELNPNHRDI